jgi:hypothetical protein
MLFTTDETDLIDWNALQESKILGIGEPHRPHNNTNRDEKIQRHTALFALLFKTFCPETILE